MPTTLSLRADFDANCAVVAVVKSPQVPVDDPEKPLRSWLEARGFIDILPEVQSPAIHVEGMATESQVVIRLFLVVAEPVNHLFRSVLQASERRMVPTRELAEVGHI